MDLSVEQRRTLIAMLCAVAWADGVVTDEEREVVRELAARFGGVSDTDLDAWLDEGPPDAALESLPEEINQLFFYEALRIAQSDGDVSDEELALLDGLVNRAVDGRPDGVILGRVRLVQRSIPPATS